MQILYHMEDAQVCKSHRIMEPTHSGGDTGPASHFLHSQLKEAVWKHPHVLKDSLELIRIVEGLHIDHREQIMLTAADVNALYPSIQLDRGMAALSWYIDHHTDLNQTPKDLSLLHN